MADRSLFAPEPRVRPSISVMANNRRGDYDWIVRLFQPEVADEPGILAHSETPETLVQWLRTEKHGSIEKEPPSDLPPAQPPGALMGRFSHPKKTRGFKWPFLLSKWRSTSSFESSSACPISIGWNTRSTPDFSAFWRRNLILVVSCRCRTTEYLLNLSTRNGQRPYPGKPSQQL